MLQVEIVSNGSIQFAPPASIFFRPHSALTPLLASNYIVPPIPAPVNAITPRAMHSDGASITAISSGAPANTIADSMEHGDFNPAIRSRKSTGKVLAASLITPPSVIPKQQQPQRVEYRRRSKATIAAENQEVHAAVMVEDPIAGDDED